MYEFVRKRKRVVQIILGLIMVPFALFGIDAYQRTFSGADDVAKVAGSTITRQEFARAWQNQQERARQMLGRAYDPAMFDTPKARQDVLDALISQRLLADYVVRGGLLVTDADLQRAILGIDAFQENGKFSMERYRSLLQAQGMTPAMFEGSLRQDIALQKLNGALAESAIASKAVAGQLLVLSTAQREVSEHVVDPAQFASQVKPTAEQIEAHYKANQKAYEVPEQARVEYVVLNQEMVAAQENVAEADVRKFYDENFGAKGKARAEARATAESLLAEVKRTPEKFAEIAKANSQDEGSAAQGGDLGFFSRGMMVKPFEEAVFRMKPGETSGIVESEFGFHIIRLAEVRAGAKGAGGEERRASHILVKAPAGVKDYAAAKPEIEAEMRRSRAGARFGKVADEFLNLADQDQDSLKPFVDRFKLQPQTTGWITRQGGPQAGVLGAPKVLDAIFKQETIKAKRATEAVEAAPGVLVVARVLEYKPAFVRPLDEVRADVAKEVVQKEASALARKAGAEMLAALRKGGTPDPRFGAPKSVSREAPAGLPAEAVKEVFRVDAAKLPAYAGADLANGGYGIYKITKTTVPEMDAKRVEATETTLARFDGRDQSEAFVAGLRNRSKVEINRANLESKQQ